MIQNQTKTNKKPISENYTTNTWAHYSAKLASDFNFLGKLKKKKRSSKFFSIPVLIKTKCYHELMLNFIKCYICVFQDALVFFF